jgi:flagellar secretion chaperone FliS
MQQTLARGAQAYYQTQIQSRSPLELVVMLYDGALRFLQQTVDAMERGDLVAKRDSLSRAMAIVTELHGMLDLEQGGEVAASLDSLYTYMIERISTANEQRDPAPLVEVMRLMTGLRDAWSQIAQQTPPPAA